ncbi:MAG: plastocyanin/azurin family copper-binding protein [Acidobacteriaceae bacterium]
MKLCRRILSPFSLFSVFLGLTLAGPLLVFATPASAQQSWSVQVGAENHDEAKQVDAFLPNEIWIYAHDSIRFKFAPKNEPHTVTLLAANQPFSLFAGPPTPPPPVGCNMVPGEGVAQPSDSFYGSAGLACVNSGPLADQATYTVNFPTPGNYKLVCLIHPDMNGVIHVLQNTDRSAPFYAASLPYNQHDYDIQGAREARTLLSDNANVMEQMRAFPRSENVVLMTGELHATTGGRQYLAIVRFLPGTILIHAGETVEWVNTDPTEPHTVTFGTEPTNPQTIVQAIPGPDGTLEATIYSPTESVSSGFLQAAPQDRAFLPESAPGTTRLRMKFTRPGVYHYICALHDVDGMVGTVIVVP